MAEGKKNSLKIRFTKNMGIFIAAVSVLAAVVLAYQYLVPKPLTSAMYEGFILNFREDLREADKVPVYPYGEALNREIMHALVENVTIAFIPVNGGDALYAVEAFEIVYKLNIGYMVNGFSPGFNAVNVTSYENLPGKIQNPIIAIVHPAYANETSVSVYGHVVTIKGETDRELDLATEKFLIEALGIDVK